jgi:hypothetical protein
MNTRRAAKTKFNRRFVGRRRAVCNHYPHFADYGGTGIEYRPFVGFVHRAGVRSPTVNTDELGLREHYDADGRFVDLTEPASLGPECNVVLGGSTAFGVGATSDRATLAARLNDPGVPCLNLGICAASSQQELALYLVLKRRLPRVRNAILLSGFNECILAASDAALFFPEYGGTFRGKVRAARFDSRALESSRAYPVHRLLHGLVDRAYGSGAVDGLSRLATRVARPRSANGRPSMWSFEDKLRALTAQVESNIETWGALQRAGNPRVHYVLQPVAPWADREPTALERKLIAAERVQIPSTRHATPEVHRWVRERIAPACERAGVAFHDANDWLGDGDFDGVDVFVDHCHLTDAGYSLLARRLRSELDWA